MANKRPYCVAYKRGKCVKWKGVPTDRGGATVTIRGRRSRRRYRCESGFTSKRDAQAEALIIKKIGHKATVKRDGSRGYKVCRTVRRR